MNVFDEYSSYYDLLYRDKDYQAESKYVSELLKRYGVEKGSEIFEIGCGTGMHALHFIQCGFKYSGIDRSESMVNEAKFRLGAEYDIKVSSAEEFNKENVVSAVVSLFHVMSYITELNKLESVFNNVSQILKPNGVFLFDCWNAPAVSKDPPVVRYKHMSSDSVEVHRVAIPTLIENNVNINFKIWVHKKKHADGKLIEENHLMRPWSFDELDTICKKTEMKIIHCEEWLTGKELTDKCWYGCYVITKV